MNEPLPDRDHVSRYCKPSTVGERGQPMASAFAIRLGEGYLSVNWLEHFGMPVGEPVATNDALSGKVEGSGEMGERVGRDGRKERTEAALNRVRETLRSKGFRLRSNGRFALLNVGTVKTTIRRTFRRSLHIDHLPLRDDASHAGILGYTERDRMIAAEIKAAVRAEDVRTAV